MRRARWLLVLGLVPALITLTTTSAFAQRYRTSDDNDRWLDRCRDDRYSDRDRDRYCEVREKTIPATRLLDVDGGQNGGIAIHAWDRDEIRVSARIQTSGDDDGDAKALADQISIEVRDGRVRAEGPSTRRRQSWSVSYDIYAPRRTDLRLNAQNGGLSVEDIEGRMDLGTVNGGLSLRRVAGDVRAETTNGGLAVELEGDRWRGPGLDARTTNGGVTLDIPRDYSARLETGTVNGSMNIDFPVTVQGSIGRRITTTLGNGGPPIRAITMNGGVRIRQNR
jgi:putative adhesin